ncbi:uncharacterized protein F58A4.6 [Cydia amplana]|uniref:uncharacterized protein F58A4.6 n=1 Tax=Cydia amplana TaxID=1869771 RepID=UPI002FE558A5
MPLVTKIRLFCSNYTICYMSEELFVFPDKKYYENLGVKSGDAWELDIERCDGDRKTKSLKMVVNALFLQPFVRECLNSKTYRTNVVNHLNQRCGNTENGTAFLKLILKPPDSEVIDYAWNERILKLVWSRVEIENAFSWLSTLGGAYSALGDYFEDCAEEAGRISLRQYKLSQMLGDDALAARSKLYSALSYAQKGKLKLSRHIVRHIHAFGRHTHDKRLVRMCQGVWAKLKYLRAIKNSSGKGGGNGKIV